MSIFFFENYLISNTKINNKSSTGGWSVNSIRNGGSRSISLVPYQYHPIECNSIGLFTYSIQWRDFEVQPTYFQNRKCINKNFERVFHLSIIIGNTIHIIYGIRTRTLFMIPYFYLISLISFLSFPFFFHFMNELRLFSHLGFTYPTYITVKGEFRISYYWVYII